MQLRQHRGWQSLAVVLLVSVASSARQTWSPPGLDLPRRQCWTRQQQLEALRAGGDDGVCGRDEQQTDEAASAPSGWTHMGRCRRLGEDEFCAFAKRGFNGGEGISVVTTRARLDETTGSLFASDEPVATTTTTTSKPYAEVSVPGKGVGLVATRAVRTGTLLMARTPAVMVDGRALGGLARGDLAALLAAAVDGLPAGHRGAFMELSTHDAARGHEDKVYKIYSTNAYRTAVGSGGDFHSTFVEVSRTNHECSPNCAAYFDPSTMAQRVYAVRDIMPGEELVAESDARVGHIKALWAELDNYSPGRNGSSSSSTGSYTGKAELLVTLFQLEGLDNRMHEAYYRAALEYNGAGDAAAAARYARLCLDRGLLVRGPDQPFLTAMRHVVEDPQRHWSWRFRVDGKGGPKYG